MKVSYIQFKIFMFELICYYQIIFNLVIESSKLEWLLENIAVKSDPIELG